MKTVIFHIMQSFRWLIVSALKILSAICCVAFIAALVSDDPNAPVFTGFIFTVIFGASSWGYDAALKRLSPIDQTNQKWS